MAEADEAPDTEEVEGAEGEAPTKKKLSGKTLVLFIIAPALLLILGGGGAYMFLFSGGDKAGEDGHAEVEHHEEELLDPSTLVFYELPEMLVNLNTSGDGNSYLKLKVAIELESEDDIAVIEPLLPRVVDRFQIYLRELRISELSGSAGMFQLKQELLRRINLAVPVTVRDVLFTEMLIQ